jgi:hypothetical protein
MSESEELISQITLECLTNEKFQAKYAESKNVSNKKNKKDRKFYKKRIHNLTKVLLNDDNTDCESKDVLQNFELYINSCIRYFKNLDKTDICQEEYVDLSLNNPSLENENENEYDEFVSKEQADKLLYKKVSTYVPNSLEKFVKRTIFQKNKDTLPFPTKKKINLKDPNLKNKGLPNSENVINP